MDSNKVKKFTLTKNSLINNLARKAARFEDDEPKLAMYFYKEIALLMANDVIAIDKQITALRKLNQVMFMKIKGSSQIEVSCSD